MYYLWGSVHRIVCLFYMWESSMEVFMNKIKLVCTISIITIIGGTLFGCNNQSSKQTVNDTVAVWLVILIVVKFIKSKF